MEPTVKSGTGSPEPETTTSLETASCSNILDFLELVGEVVHLKRAGWVRKNIDDGESVAGHIYRMALLTFLRDDESMQHVNRVKCMEMALIHDLAEAIVGDITPHDNISPTEKHRRQLEAMKTMTSKLPTKIGKRLMEIFEEYEARESPESKLVKELDMFDFIHQCYEYEKTKNVTLEDFYLAGAPNGFSNPFLRRMKKALDERRNKIE